jgi:hypothetical protein
MKEWLVNTDTCVIVNWFIKVVISELGKHEVAEPPLEDTPTPFNFFTSYLSSLCKAASG